MESITTTRTEKMALTTLWSICGELKKNHFEPSQALALALKKEQFKTAQLNIGLFAPAGLLNLVALY